MPPTPLFHPNAKLGKLTGRLGKLNKKEASSLGSLKQLVRKQGLTLGLVRGPSEQQDVCLLRFLRAQGFEEKRVSSSPFNRSRYRHMGCVACECALQARATPQFLPALLHAAPSALSCFLDKTLLYQMDVLRHLSSETWHRPSIIVLLHASKVQDGMISSSLRYEEDTNLH